MAPKSVKKKRWKCEGMGEEMRGEKLTANLGRSELWSDTVKYEK